MKRSILFGVLAMFAVSAVSVQDLNAQNEGSKPEKEVVNQEPAMREAQKPQSQP